MRPYAACVIQPARHGLPERVLVDTLFTVMLVCLTERTTRFCLVRAGSAGAIIAAAGPALPAGTHIAAVLDIVVPPSCVTCADGAAHWPRGRQATDSDFEGPMPLEEFAAMALRPAALAGNSRCLH